MNENCFYTLYGLCIRTNMPIDFLPAALPGAADVVIQYDGKIPRPAGPPPSKHMVSWSCEPGGSWLLVHRNIEGDVAVFRLHSGGSLVVLQHSNPEWRDILAALLGQVLGAALRLRGVFALHATSLTTNGSAVAIMGTNETGKSTLSATLISEGMALLSDDLSAFAFSGDSVSVQPGYPRLQIYPDSASALGYKSKDMPRVVSSAIWDDKRWLDVRGLPGGFYSFPAPLRAIYLIDGRRKDLDVPQIEPLPPGLACISLTGHIYGARWLNIPCDSGLRLCARIAERVPVCRVLMPDDLANVPAAARALISDARRFIQDRKFLKPGGMEI
jgi:hypothetical protein